MAHSPVAFRRALDGLLADRRRQAETAWRRCWLRPECPLLRHTRAVQGRLDPVDRARVEQLLKRADVVRRFYPHDGSQAGDGEHPAVAMLRGLLHAVLAAGHLQSWLARAGATVPTEFVRSACECGRACEGAWRPLGGAPLPLRLTAPLSASPIGRLEAALDEVRARGRLTAPG
jgi:hypothetical protein